ncbi:MAG TPA: undecaprenyl/decaprenyl-phosphate alpha-N-acetylglucosaminyl 1-phosphate transferase [Polyangia bacterium]|jgi:UDP-GlcNAc:undecaprenyl-phosphate GlcNAc-1-phosphate transferase|nr:undecaprenyl/decaprenyl-phosphate alpha-N-acetylglucosaminyl 1-phosphate transferase [Polyangia bacterium]
MRTAAIAFVLATACAALLTPLIRTLALRLGVLDHALSSRKIHGRPVPRLGGIAIVAAFYVPLIALNFFRSEVGRMFLAERNQAVGLFMGGLLIAFLGIYDDLWGAGAKRKFVVQFAVAGLLYYLGFRIDAVANPFGEPLHLGWAGLPFTLLWMVGVVNAMNLIDGLDGLAGGVGLVAVITTFLVALQRGHPLMILFCAALGGAILGFLFYNFNPASIFMGDTGSMFIGFVLAAAAIQTNQKSSTAVAVIIPAIALGLPILDTILAMSRRAVRGRPLFRADKEHIHHRLIAVGLSHRQAVLLLYGLTLFFGAVALALTYATSGETAAILIVLGILAFLFLRWLGYIQLSQMLPEQRRRSRALRAAVRPFADRLRRATNLDEVWSSIRDVMGVFAAKCARLDLSSRGQNGRSSTPVSFAYGYDEAAEMGISSKLFRARFVLVGVKPDDGAMEMAWDDGRRELDRDTEIAIELFCDYLAQACDRVRETADATSPAKTATPNI